MNKEVEEAYKDIKNYEGLYQISNFGKVRSLKRYVNAPQNGGVRQIKERILVPTISSTGYYQVTFGKNGITDKEKYSIHKLVLLYFIPNPYKKRCGNHKDGNKLNNHISNLEWCTYKENMEHAFRTKLCDTKKRVKIIELDKDFESITDCEMWLKSNGYSKGRKSTISMVCNNKLKTHCGLTFRFIKEE